MQQSFQYFGQSHAGQLQQTEALEALQHAGEPQCQSQQLVSSHLIIRVCIAAHQAMSKLMHAVCGLLAGPMHACCWQSIHTVTFVITDWLTC